MDFRRRPLDSEAPGGDAERMGGASQSADSRSPGASVEEVDRPILGGSPRPIDPGSDLERLEVYLPDFAEACLLEGEDVALLSAICLRETWAGWAPGYKPKGSYIGRGDHGHGFGLFQMDDRGPYKHLPRECPEATPFLQCRWACQVLRDARRDLRKHRDHPLFERAVLSVYNAGAPRVAKALVLGHDPDSVTSAGPLYRPRRGDYGAHVLSIRDQLRRDYADRFPVPTNWRGDPL